MTIDNIKSATDFKISDSTLIATGRDVFHSEATALQTMGANLNATFAKAVRMIVACQGRVIISGMGKSGHIARKIAATMASTGTPAFFIHPGEASHGDLGMVMANDLVIAISNSGETAELTDLIAYSRRFSIPLIGITSREQSGLAQAADVLLLLADAPEVGSLGLAPTTSTTMALALGDALSVAALECRGFTAEDFRNFHPGGKLGKMLLRVSDIMSKGDAIPLAKESDKMSDVLLTMTGKSLGCAGIVNSSGRLVGIITDGDLRRHMQDGLMQKTAADVMTHNPMTVAPRLLAVEVLKILNDKKRTQIFVVENDLPVGVVHIHDLLKMGVA